MRALEIIELIEKNGYEFYNGRLHVKYANNTNKRNIWIEFKHGEIEIRTDTIKIRIRTENRYLLKDVLADLGAAIKFIEGIK